MTVRKSRRPSVFGGRMSGYLPRPGPAPSDHARGGRPRSPRAPASRARAASPAADPARPARPSRRARPASPRPADLPHPGPPLSPPCHRPELPKFPIPARWRPGRPTGGGRRTAGHGDCGRRDGSAAAGLPRRPAGRDPGRAAPAVRSRDRQQFRDHERRLNSPGFGLPWRNCTVITDRDMQRIAAIRRRRGRGPAWYPGRLSFRM